MKCNNILLLAGLAVIASACADDFDQTFKVDAPASLQQYAYLSEYAPLKDYINRANTGNFKLGAGVTASEFNKSGVQFSLASSNFDEVVAGNAMKMASCVGDDGTMDFSTVEDFVDKAKSAGLTVYGHTLAWHSQQANKWLKETVLADHPIEGGGNNMEKYYAEAITNGDCEGAGNTNFVCRHYGQDDVNPTFDAGAGKDGSKGIKFECTAKVVEAWDNQFFIYLPKEVLNSTDKIHFKMDVKADKAASIGTQAHAAPGAYLHWAFIGNVNFTTDWTTHEFEGNVTADGVSSIALNLNDFADANVYYFDNISWEIEKERPAGPTKYMADIVENSDCEGAANANFVCRHYGQSDVNPTFEAGAGNDGSKGIKFECSAKVAEAWDNQFFVYVPKEVLGTKDKIVFKMDVKADKPASIGTQAHGAPGSYIHWAFIGNVNFTTEWTTHVFEGNVTADGVSSVALNLNDFADANTYYFDNIVWQVEKESKGGGLPQTEEEMYANTYAAMDSWIKGMMQACAGKVVAWDVVNEPISGADNDGDGYYDLQHASTASEADKENCFYWTDYLGDIDYVRTAVGSARRHFAEFGGNASELKLFINDYNLESWWDGNKKLNSLVNWISKWENDTVKIDGIGTQMHISCYEKPENQAAIENSIVKMFEIMAATGKLCRISELDMGYVAADNMFADPLKTSELTEEQHKKMAEFYKWIVKKYFEIIPAAQRYGITQWCLTDAPANSGWRGGEPVGLWDINYNRKHVYAGFAEGLSEATK